MQREFLALVRQAADSGTTVFLSSHVLAEIQRAADRVAVLRAGEVIAYSTVEELRRRARQSVEIWFESEPPMDELSKVGGLQDLKREGRRVTATLGGGIQQLIDMLARQRVASMLVEQPDLEEAFIELYDAAG
jgi:ABC-2 type transport system ATP-binding protein